MITTVSKNDAVWSFYPDEPCCCSICGKELKENDYHGWVWKSDGLTDKAIQYLYCPNCK